MWIYESTYLSIWQYLSESTYLHIRVHNSTYLSIWEYLPEYMSTFPCIWGYFLVLFCINESTYLHIWEYLSEYMRVCILVNESAYLSVWPQCFITSSLRSFREESEAGLDVKRMAVHLLLFLFLGAEWASTSVTLQLKWDFKKKGESEWFMLMIPVVPMSLPCSVFLYAYRSTQPLASLSLDSCWKTTSRPFVVWK